MTAPTLREIVTGIEERLRTIDGLRVGGFAPDQISPPAAFVTVPPIDYRAVFGAKKWQLNFRIVVLVSAASDKLREQKLAEYADHTGDKSIFAAFGGMSGAGTLGGRVEQAYIPSFQPLGAEEVGLLTYYGGSWPLLVVAPGV